MVALTYAMHYWSIKYYRKLKRIIYLQNRVKSQNGGQKSKMAVNFMMRKFISQNVYTFLDISKNKNTSSWCFVFAQKILLNSMGFLLSYGTLKFDLFLAIGSYREIESSIFYKSHWFQNTSRVECFSEIHCLLKHTFSNQLMKIL